MISRRITKHRTGRRFITGIAALGLIAGSLLTYGTALAAGPGQNFFELDASQDQSNGAAPKAAIDDPAVGEDWNKVAAGTSTALATSFDSETTATGSANNATIFTGGGSKDKLPIEGWGWKDAAGGLPDKDNLLHAMSARYGSGATAHIYFAADRFDNSGDAQIGFWFLNQQVGPVAGGGFSGSHTAGVVPHDPAHGGDILILSDFTNGGAQPTIRVFEYVGSGGSEGSLQLLGGTDVDVRDCATVSTDDFCGSVNNLDGAIAPWLFLNKSGQNTFGHGEFYEGGLNLAFLGLQNECFSSFLAETRSSQSVTATLKDFVSGPFQSCTSGVVTTPNVSSASIGTGSVTVHDAAAVTVTNAASFTGTLDFHLCGPIANATDNCRTGGVAVAAAAGVNPVTANGSYNSADTTITSAGRYCWRANYTSGTTGVPSAVDPKADSTSLSECFTITPVTPGLDTAAVASPVNLGSAVQDNATLSGTTTQPGSPIINGSPGPAAGGTIKFTLLKADCSTLATGTGTNPQSVNVSGNATYGPVSFTPDATGTYHWKAEYIPATGDVNNIGSTHNGSCDDADEAVVVQNFPTTTTTRQFVYPQDKAKITVGGGGNLAGSVNFRLYDTSANCVTNGGTAATGMLYEELGAAHPIAGASPQFATTNNTTVAITSSTTVWWRVTYASTNSSQPSSGSACLESTQATYAGNDATITVP